MDQDIPEVEDEERDEETGPLNRGDSEPEFDAEFEVRCLLSLSHLRMCRTNTKAIQLACYLDMCKHMCCCQSFFCEDAVCFRGLR